MQKFSKHSPISQLLFRILQKTSESTSNFDLKNNLFSKQKILKKLFSKLTIFCSKEQNIVLKNSWDDYNIGLGNNIACFMNVKHIVQEELALECSLVALKVSFISHLRILRQF